LIKVMKVNEPHFYPLWHFHPQCEIMLIEKSSGTRYVGDNIGQFRQGDVILFGPNVPHLLRNGKEYFESKSKRKAKATVLYFNETLWGIDFYQLPEMGNIRDLLKKARYGIHFDEKYTSRLKEKIHKVTRLEGLERILQLIYLLHYMAENTSYQVLSSAGFLPSFNEEDVDTLNKITDYLMKNFSREIKLKTVSEMANMSPTSFCRYFKARTNKTLVSFLNEIRVGYACKMLIENINLNISQVCFESGFNNLTNFNIQFKKIKSKSPLEYRNSYLK
jgi:AraC-like DNA-binding protein